MGSLLVALATENTHRQKTKRLALKLAQCLVNGSDEDIIVAAELLPTFQNRLACEHAKVRARLARRFA
jgi:hypothetical protein